MKIVICKIIGIILLLQLLYSCNISKKEASEGGSKSIAKDTMLHFGQPPPSKTPMLYAPDIISKSDRHEFGCTLSKDGKEFYFGVDNNGKMEIHQTTLENGKWTSQENLFPEDSCSYNDPMFSLDENRLYFISNRPLKPNGNLKDIDIWYIERIANGWSKPINLGAPINNNLNQYYSSFSNQGTLYFASKDKAEDAPRYAFDIYKSEFKNGKYLSPQKLPKEINTNRYEADVFIAPDESYMIFCSIRRNGLGQGDLYVSFKDDNGNWTNAINMGDEINSDKHELCPFVTKDEKYLEHV